MQHSLRFLFAYLLGTLCLVTSAYGQTTTEIKPTLEEAAFEPVKIVTYTSGALSVCADPYTIALEVSNASEAPISLEVIFPGLPANVSLLNAPAGWSVAGAGENLSFVPEVATQLNVGDKLNLSYTVTAGCDLLTELKPAKEGTEPAPLIVNNTTRFSYYDAKGNRILYYEPLLTNDGSFSGSASYNVIYPDLALETLEGSQITTYYDRNIVYERKYRLVNYGKGILYKARLYVAYDADIFFVNANFNGQASGFVKDQELSDAYKQVYYYDIEIPEGIQPQQSYAFEDYVRMLNCNATLETEFWVEWGCDETVCNESNPEARTTAYINMPGGTPSMSARPSYEILNRNVVESEQRVEVIAAFDMKNLATVEYEYNRYASAAYDMKLFNIGIYNNTVKVKELYLFDRLDQNTKYLLADTYDEATDTQLNVNEDIGVLIKNAIDNGTLTVNQARDAGLKDLDLDGLYNDLLAGENFYLGYLADMDLSIYKEMASTTQGINIGSNLNFGFQVGCERYTEKWIRSNYHMQLHTAFNPVAKDELIGPEFKGDKGQFTYRYTIDNGHINYNTGYPFLPSTRYENTENGHVEIIIDAPDSYNLIDNRAYNYNGADVSSSVFNGSTVSTNTVSGRKKISIVTEYKAARLYFEFDFTCTATAVAGTQDDISLEYRYIMDDTYPSIYALGGNPALTVNSPCVDVQEVKTTGVSIKRATFGKVLKSGSNKLYTLAEYEAAPDYTEENYNATLDRILPFDKFNISIGGVNENTSNVSSYTTQLTFTGEQEEALQDYFTTDLSKIQATVTLSETEEVIATLENPQITGNTLSFLVSLPAGKVLAPGAQFTTNVTLHSQDYSYPTNGVFPWMIEAAVYETTPAIKVNIPFYLYYYGPAVQGHGGALDCNINVVTTQIQVSYANFNGEYRKTKALDKLLFFVPKGYLPDPNTISFQQWGTNGGTYTLTNETGYNVSVHKLSETDLSSFPAEYELLTQDDLELYSYFVVVEAQRGSDNAISRKVPVLPSYYNWHTRIYVDFAIDPAYAEMFSDENLPEDIHYNSRLKSRLYIADKVATEREKVEAYPWRNANISYRRKPKLVLTANRIQEGYAREVAWPVQLCNEGTNNNAFGTFVAVELAPDDNISELLRVELEDGKVIDLTSEDERVVKYIKDGNQSYFVWLGDLPRSSCGYITIVGGYREEEGDVFEDRELTLKAFAGALCDFEKPKVEEMALTTNNYGVEWLDEQVVDRTFKRLDLILRYRSANLQWRVDQLDAAGNPGQEAVGLCENVTYEVSLESTRQANIYDLALRFDLPYGVSLQNVEYLYPEANAYQPLPAAYLTQLQAGSGQSYVESGEAWALDPERFSIYSIGVAQLLDGLNGTEDAYLPGTRLAAANEIKFRITVSEDCDFDPGQALYFNVTGTTHARRPINLASLQKIRLEEFPLDKLELSMTSADITNCTGNTWLYVNLENSGELATQPEVLYVQLPEGMIYIRPNSTSTLPYTIQNAPTNTPGALLEFALAEGALAPGETKNLRILVRDQLINAESLRTLNIQAYTRMNGQATCVLDESQCPLVATTSGNQLTLNSQSIPPQLSLSVSPDELTYVCADQQDITITSQISYPVIDPFGEITGRSHTYTWFKQNENGGYDQLLKGNGTAFANLVLPKAGYNDLGVYKLHIRDRQSGCTVEQTVELLPTKFHPDFELVKQFVYDESCNYQADGRFGFKIVKAGKEVAERNFSYTYSLNTGGISGSAVEDTDYAIESLAPGNYTLTVTNDYTGCSRTLAFAIKKGAPVFSTAPKAIRFSSDLLEQAYGTNDRVLLNWNLRRNGTIEGAPTSYTGFSVMKGAVYQETVYGMQNSGSSGESYDYSVLQQIVDYQGTPVTFSYDPAENYYFQVYDALCDAVKHPQPIAFVQPGINVSMLTGNTYTRCSADQPISLEVTFAEAAGFDTGFNLNDGFAWSLYQIGEAGETLVANDVLTADNQNSALLQQSFEGLSDGAYRFDVQLTGKTDATDAVLNAALQRVSKSYTFTVETREISVEMSSTPVTCLFDANGTVSAQVSGATGTIVYNWYDEFDTFIGGTQQINDLPEGTYYLEITDDSECQSGGERYEVSVGIMPEADGVGLVVDHTTCSVTIDLEITDGTAADYVNNLTLSLYKKYERKKPSWSFFNSPETTECEEDTDFATRYSVRNNCYSFDRVFEEKISMVEGQSLYSVIASFDGQFTPGYEYDIVVTSEAGCEYISTLNYYIPESDIQREYTYYMRWTTEPVKVTPEAPETVNVNQTTIAAAKDTKVEFRKRAEQCIADAEARSLAAFESLCLTTDLLDEELKIGFSQEAYQFTLYYYDRAGNLKKTVPPAGVSVNGPGQHQMETQYAYNNRGQLIWQSTPDGGVTRFIYNKIGQLRFSQNQKQQGENAFSYTKYDALGRVREVGEAAGAAIDWASLKAAAENDQPASVFPDATSYTLSQRTRTFYGDDADNGPQTIDGSTQRYTLNRVSHTQHTNPNGQQVTTYYSYDPHGNVEWLIQELPGLARKKVAYRYDLISGNVLQVSYNEGHSDQFFHRYGYDADNRLISVETSTNGRLWDTDATYDYYQHGPLKRMELGQQKVQGLDYIYTLQGWLKAMNAPTLDPDEDPGHDGQEGGLPADAYGMMLTYYSGDYQNSQVLQNRPAYENTAAITSLYNGNIAGWTDGYHNPQSQTSEVFNRQFTYDKLNRLVESRYQQLQDDGSYTSLADAYRTAYSYDGNGNLLSLERHDAQGRQFDALSYSYQEGNNRLRHVKDQGQVLVTADDGSIVELGEGETLDLTKLAYNDLQEQDNDNYAYDELGNLVLDKQERITIAWTVYGKVDQVMKYADAEMTQLQRIIAFAYDAMGNRINKTVSEYTADGSAVAHTKTTYYMRDAQGNTLAVYEQTDTDGQQRTSLNEQPIYGSDRLGQRMPEKLVVAETRSFTDAGGNPLASYELQADELQQQYTGGWVAAAQEEGVGSQLQWLSPQPDGSLKQTALADLGTASVSTTASLADARTASAYALAVVTDGIPYLQLLNKDGGLMDGLSNPPALYKGSPLFMGENWVLALGADGSLLRQDIDAESNNVVSTAQTLLTDVRGMALQQLADESYTLYVLRRLAEGQLQLQAWPVLADGSLQSTTRWQSTAFAGSTALNVRHLLRLHPDGRLLALATSPGSYDDVLELSEGGSEVRVYLTGAARQEVLFSQPLSSLSNRLDALSWQPDGKALLAGLTEMTGTGEPQLQYSLKALQLKQNALPLVAEETTEGPVQLLATDKQLFVSSSSAGGISNYSWQGNSLQPAFENALLAGSSPQHYSGLQQLNNPEQQYARNYGLKRYELKDHLGNVRVTLSDRLLQNASGASAAEVTSYANYYPFGWGMPGLEGNSGSYRYGFNGMEKDDEIKGSGASYDFGARMYDPRVARWLSVDPQRMKGPDLTPYRFGFNNPVVYKDPDGQWEEDGHFWTVFAFGISVGLDKATAFKIAQAAEYYDHKVHNDFSMTITPMEGYEWMSWGRDGGVGTWGDPDYQGPYHGLTGNSQNEVLRNAFTSIYLGDFNSIHTLGDAWAHSFVNNQGRREMYGDSKVSVPWGEITLEHAFFDHNGNFKWFEKDLTDRIEHRKDAYQGYLQTLQLMFNSPDFEYSTSQKAEMWFFNYVQENGGNKRNNIMLFSAYIALKTGSKTFTFGAEFSGDYENGVVDKQLELFTGYLDKAGVSYSISSEKRYKKRWFWHGLSGYKEHIGDEYTVTIDDSDECN